MKVCAVIVTYNRKELLLENLNSISNQVFRDFDIIVVDNNSSDNTMDYLKNNYEDFERINYHYLDENTGGAGGFNYGVKIAYENKYDWIILMDDDGKPFDNKCFSNMLDFISDNNYNPNQPIILNSLVTSDGENLSFGLGSYDTIKKLNDSGIIKDNCIDNLINPFNGTFISYGLIKLIGFPNKDFFIKGDEVDYTLRALKNGAIVKTVSNSLYRHPKISNRKRKKVFGHEMYVFVEAPWKEYYSSRNFVFSILQNVENKKEQRRRIRLFKLKRLYCVLTSKCKKISTLKMIRKGIKDAKKGRMGPTIRP